MVLIKHHGDNAEKCSEILEAAQKRFGLYGLEKTTMREIAADLSMSKGTLYYYFPDKESLFRAVIAKEQEIFLTTVRQKIAATEDPEMMLREFVNTRISYFRSLVNLNRYRVGEFRGMKKLLGDLWSSFREKENGIICGIFRTGMGMKAFYIKDPQETTTLFLDLLGGLRQMIMKSKEIIYLEEEEYNALVRKTSRFTELFLRGIRRQPGDAAEDRPD